MYTRIRKTNRKYSLTCPKAGKNSKSSFIPFYVESAGNAFVLSVGTAGLEPATSAM